jgi:NCAIR mutase (PurE)-related protein
VYCAGKTPAQVGGILERLLQAESSILATRASEEHFAVARALDPRLACDGVSRTISLARGAAPGETAPLVAVVCAGTSDIPVAEEAAVTVSTFGNRALRVYDVGVAGIHRLFARIDAIREADVVIAVAGMEGALPSVLGGLVAAPVIAVPTSVGYGASLGGLAALLAMLNSCAAGVTVVNIDNGFGAGSAASAICARITSRRGTS